MKKYLFIVLLVGFAFGQTKILKMETKYKTYNGGELKSIVGNKILYQSKNQFFIKGNIDSINAEIINRIIFFPSSIAKFQSSLLNFSVLALGGLSAFIEGWYGYQVIFGTSTNTIILTIAAIYYKSVLLKKNTLKMDNWNELEKILYFEELLLNK
tara:strand:+ start:202 stop:666 length:465 start_codon:yes stop_codon:yes gene_type:complete